MERLGVSVSEEKLKKGIEEDGADGYDAEVPDKDWVLKWIRDYFVIFAELKLYSTKQTLLVYAFSFVLSHKCSKNTASTQ